MSDTGVTNEVLCKFNCHNLRCDPRRMRAGRSVRVSASLARSVDDGARHYRIGLSL
jgi:hypothetical protein